MNHLKAWERRDELNEKMSRNLLQALEGQLVDYLRVIENYPPDRMEKFGTPFVNMLEHKISTMKLLIEQKFTK